jgi:hypothetical protein
MELRALFFKSGSFGGGSGACGGRKSFLAFGEDIFSNKNGKIRAVRGFLSGQGLRASG